MKSSDRSILIGVGVLALLAVFWFMFLAPKRDEASKLQAQIDDLQTQVAAAQQGAQAAKQAEDQYATNYRKVVALGKAAPADGDTSSFVQQLQSMSDKAKVGFESLELTPQTDSSAQAPVTPPTTAAPTSTPAPATATPTSTATPSSSTPTTASSPTDTSTESASSVGTSVAGAAGIAATPTESSAATLPLGAGIGSAGLPVMPYDLTFQGGFFQVADLFGELDSGVKAKGGSSSTVAGRLVTVSGFDMSSPEDGKGLETNLHLTTYVLPAAQGLTAGATPAAPPTEVPSAATPTPVTTPTPAPAATVAP